MMTLKQRIIRLTYPIVMQLARVMNKEKLFRVNEELAPPHVPFYQLHFEPASGGLQPMDGYKGKKLLLVNTASDCGFTPQLQQLQALQNQYADRLIVIGFPSNDFKEQEKGDDREIARFCSLNYGVSFLLAKKSGVLKTADQNTIFAWLTNQRQNGWNNNPPAWNFTKYLVNEQGVLTHIFNPGVSPLANEVTSAL